jgi:hypothetical protein
MLEVSALAALLPQKSFNQADNEHDLQAAQDQRDSDS